jgi:hypothetical protein
MARGGARPGAGRPARKSANTSPPSTRARARARGGGSENQRPWPADKVERSPPSTRARARARGGSENQRPWPADKVEGRQNRRTGTKILLVEDDLLHKADAAAAIFLRPRDADPPGGMHFLLPRNAFFQCLAVWRHALVGGIVDTQISGGRFASSQWRNSARKAACSGLSAKSMGIAPLLTEDVERQERADHHVRDIDQLAQFEVDGDAADRIGLLPVPAAFHQ